MQNRITSWRRRSSGRNASRIEMFLSSWGRSDPKASTRPSRCMKSDGSKGGNRGVRCVPERQSYCFSGTQQPASREGGAGCYFFSSLYVGYSERGFMNGDSQCQIYGLSNSKVYCRMATTSRYSASIKVLPSVAVLCAVQSSSSSSRRADCFSASSAANAL